MRLLAGAALAALLALGAASCGGGQPGAATFGTSPNGGTQQPQQTESARVTVHLKPGNAAGLSATAVLTPAPPRKQKTRVTIHLSRQPHQPLTAGIDVGSCSKTLALRPEWVLGTMHDRRRSWVIAGRLASFQSAASAVVVRTSRQTKGGPVAACGAVPNPSA